MPDTYEPLIETPQPSSPIPPLELRDGGRILLDGIVVGRLSTEDNGTLLMLNLGWCREAGLHLRLLADPEVDRSRRGIVLDR